SRKCAELPQAPLAVMPMPAMMVLPDGSVGSSPRLAIESEDCLSVSAFQVAPPSCVTKTPPLVVLMNIVFGPSAGSGRIDWTAPASLPFGLKSPVWTKGVGPKRGAGPCD